MEATLERTVALAPEHISAYCLTYEEDTEFFLRQARGEYRADVDTDALFFETTMRVLEAAGYRQYEISNYARPGHESAHNRGSGPVGRLLGLGPSAFSTVGSKRWQNVADYRIYSGRLGSGTSAVILTDSFPGDQARGADRALAPHAVGRSGRLAGAVASRMR